jgi:SAM-dependent methyltransferase
MPRLEDCWFYHTFDFPNIGVIPGNWDLRGRVEAYLGHVHFAGKRVLELGTASGFLALEMEKRGADVVAFDIAENLLPDLVPHASHLPIHAMQLSDNDFYRRLRNSFHFAQEQFGGHATHVTGNIYDLAPSIGLVDVSTFGSILMHLRDPFLALANAARFTRETMIITDRNYETPEYHAMLRAGQPAPVAPMPSSWAFRGYRKLGKLLFGDEIFPSQSLGKPLEVPAMMFLPNIADPELKQKLNSWFAYSPLVLQRMLGILGFADCTLTYHTQKYFSGEELQMFTLVARRTEAQRSRIDGPYPW